MCGHWRPKLETRREVRTVREQSDGEDSARETGTEGFFDVTAEMEVELLLPLEVDMKPGSDT